VLDPYEKELRIAIAEGILSREDADALADEARQKKQSPLTLLVARGRLSEETFGSLRAEALAETARGDADPNDSTSTGAPPPEARDSEVPAFPVAGWDRYTSVRFLGQGGMGKVFLAFDPKLRREVAIKFVLGDNPDHVRRLVAEARAQARVHHERVCKVYEVGEVLGKVYIAMEYIDGKPLGSLAGELTVEQKVMLVRGAAEGVHEAHRVGIIHRDIKPSNIMVERSDDGELRPYVMDFGLAHSGQEGGTTMTGAVLGTPRYMAPEQARGEVARLDRRADVYSLGATLYHLLTGEPPIPGSSFMEVLSNLATMEPRPLHALDPHVPVDLETIVLKCLEKDRSARYDSARALAEDLGRFLNGEPILARAAGVGYRLRKWIAKQRRLVAVIATALVLLLVVLGWGIKTRREANERERLARRFTELVEHMEAMARYSALSPLHDIRGDHAAIRVRMDELDAEIRRAGAVAVGPGHYALGRGYLALGDDAKAREHLESAWQHGYREPRATYALALVLGHLYQRALLEAEKIQSVEQREAKKREIERQYRDPALEHLKHSEDAEVPSTEYVAALVAFYEDRLDEGLKHLDAIGGGLPWFYEAPELRGAILLARALKLRNQGEYERAGIDFEAGRKAYAAAGVIGESVPAVHEAMGELELAAMLMELYGRGEVLLPFTRGIEATGRALAAMPDHYASLVLTAHLRRTLAEYKGNQGSKAEDLLTKAITDAQRAIAAFPERPQARLELARIYRQWGEVRQGQSQDPSEQLRKAVETSESIRSEDRDATYYGNLGLVFKVWADYEDQVGADAQANRGKAIDAYSMAIQLDDKITSIWINLGVNYYMRASQPRAKDPDGDLKQAIQALDKAKAINPKHIVPYYYEGQIYELMAQQKRARGIDPGPELARALDVYKEGLTINPKLPDLHTGIGAILMEQAKEAWDRGVRPDPLLDQARAAFEQTIAAAPEKGFGYANVGEVFALQAQFQRSRGEDPSAAALAAVDVLKRAIERIPDHPTFWADLGMAHSILAAYELEQGRDPQPSLVQASSAIRNALEKNPEDAQSQFYLGETRGTRARFRALQRQGRSEDFEEAAQAFQKAIDLSPEKQEYQIAFGHFCRAWASFQGETGKDPDASLKRGIELANQVLGRRPTWPDARVLRASLLLLLAQRSTRAEERRDQGARAAEDFAKALAVNPVLEKVWRSQVAFAQQIAAGPR
jgi:eukaryotic-like serine/threonine-protein kinase